MNTGKIVVCANESWGLWIYRKEVIERLVAAGFEVVAVTGDDAYRVQLEGLGARLEVIPLQPRGTSVFGGIASVLALARLIRRERPGYMLSYNPKASMVAAAANLLRWTRHVSTISGFGVMKESLLTGGRGLKERLKARLVGHFLITLPDVVAVQNQADFEHVCGKRQGRRRTIRVHGSGVDLARFHPVERDYTAPRVLFASRFLLQKGIADYIEAARVLGESGLRFRLGGVPVEGADGLSEEAVLAMIADAPIDYLGRIEPMEAELARTDIVVLPSRYGEGVPRILLEAAAAGCIPVAYDIDGVREVILDDETGRLVDPDAEGGLVGALRALAEAEPEELARLAAGARAHVERLFSVEAVVQSYLDIIREQKAP